MEPLTQAIVSGARHGVTTIPLEFFVVGDIELNIAKAEPVRSRWIYVFKRYDWGTSLYAELYIDASGKKKLVNWQGQHWGGNDERPATVSHESFEVVYHPEHYEIFCFLSHVQISRARIEDYTGTSGLSHVSRRAMSVNVRESEYVIQDGAGAGCHVYLIDYLEVARRKHDAFRDALNQYASFISEDQSNSRQLLATVALNVADQVAKNEEDVWSWLQDGGKPLRLEVNRFSNRRQALFSEVNARAGALTSWMRESSYEEMLLDYTGTDALENEGHDLQANLVDGLSQCGAGRTYIDYVLQHSESWHNKYVVPAGTHAFAVADKAVGTASAALIYVQEFAGGIARRNMQQAVTFVYLSFQIRFELSLSLQVLSSGRGGTLIWQEMAYTHIVTAPVIGVRVDVDAMERAMRAGRVGDAAGVREAGIGRIIAVINIVNLALAGKGLADARGSAKKAQALVALAGACADSVAAIAGSMKQTVAAKKVGTTASIAGGVLTYVGAIPEIVSSSYEGNWGLVAGWSAVALGGAAGAASAGVGTAAAFGLTVGPLGLIAAVLALGGVALIWAFTESPLEEWFEQSPWGTEPSNRSINDHLERLLRIIGRPRLELSAAGSDLLKIVVAPSFALPGQTAISVHFELTCVTYTRTPGKWAVHEVKSDTYRIGALDEYFAVSSEADMKTMARMVRAPGPVKGSNTARKREEVTYSARVRVQFLDNLEVEKYEISGKL